ncbi:MAG: FAD-dependent oxidoreductase, partial [Legionella sp.]
RKGRHTPWQVAKPSLAQEKKAVVVGAGLAGCFTAYALAERGWQVILLDQAPQLSQGASANTQAVLFPKLSAYRSPLTQFMLSSFLYAHRFYTALLQQFDIGELQGSFLLAHTQREANAQQSLSDWLQIYPELGQLMTAAEGAKQVGLPIAQDGLFIPFSGWLDMPALCQILAKHPRIELIYNTSVQQLELREHLWTVAGINTPVVILCNGYQANTFIQTDHLPIKPIRGQMTSIPANAHTQALKIPLCGEGHVLPARAGQHHLGASYDLGIAELNFSTADDETNLAKLKQLTPAVSWANQQVCDHWVGVRAATPDYLPLVGPVAQAEPFSQRFKSLELNARRWIAQPGVYYPGLFICAGFGSRGLTTIPLSAEFLAALINQEITCLPRNLIQALSPARFLRKNITRGIG